MTNKKTLGLAALIAVFVTVIGGFVVYAALTQQLDFKGTADFVPESWKVNFVENSSIVGDNPVATGGAEVDSAPILTGTLISDYHVILTREGDSVTYTFDIANTGSIDAKLTSFQLGTPTCKGKEDSLTKERDEEIVCSDNLKYTLKYVGGDLGDNDLSVGNNVAVGNMLKSNKTVTVELKLEFSENVDELPIDPVKIEGLNSFLFYSAQ